MNDALPAKPAPDIDHLADYIDGVRELGQKFGIVAKNQRGAADSLSRAVSALRSMAAASPAKSHSNSRPPHLATENAGGTSGWS